MSSFHGAAAASADAGEHAEPGNSSTMASRSSPSTAPVPSDLAAIRNGTAAPGSMPPRAHPSPSPHLLAVAAGALVIPASSESVRSVRIRSTTLARLLHGFVLLPSGISVAGTGNAMI